MPCFVIMDNAVLLAEYALTLQEIVCGTDWTAFGLPSEMSIRIGLHAGPVYEGINPLTGTTTFYGSHVNRAARLESVTVPRQVYATEQFAALLTAEQLVQGDGAAPLRLPLPRQACPRQKLRPPARLPAL